MQGVTLYTAPYTGDVAIVTAKRIPSLAAILHRLPPNLTVDQTGVSLRFTQAGDSPVISPENMARTIGATLDTSGNVDYSSYECPHCSGKGNL